MRRTISCLLLLAGACCAAADDGQMIDAQDLMPLPAPVTNNAVAAVSRGERRFLLSFAGLGAGRRAADVLAATYVFDSDTGRWRAGPPLPGGAGRLAASAAAAGGLAYVFGGYTVAADGVETSTPWVHAFDPLLREYQQRARMPVPVDDAVALVYQDRYIYLLSGWHDLGNVNLTQRYDSATDTWAQATPIPGRAVFGHSGGIVGNRMLFCDGVAIQPSADRRREFVASDACFLGTIDAADSRRIDWRTVAAHSGLPRYRMAAAGMEGSKTVLFIGGSENPYNYNGIGYDGKASQPAANALLFDLDASSWRVLPQSNAPSMDHRGLVAYGDRWVTIGGMLAGQQVTSRVTAYQP